MQATVQTLYQFLSACRGNWRNTLFIAYRHRAGSPGVLMAMGRDAKPVFMDLEQFCQLTGEQIDPTECRGQLTQAAFEDIFAQYLLWRLPSGEVDTLRTIVCMRSD